MTKYPSLVRYVLCDEYQNTYTPHGEYPKSLWLVFAALYTLYVCLVCVRLFFFLIVSVSGFCFSFSDGVFMSAMIPPAQKEIYQFACLCGFVRYLLTVGE